MQTSAISNPVGSGTRNVSGNISDEYYEELLKLAEASGLKGKKPEQTGVGTYVKCLVAIAVESKTIFTDAWSIANRASNRRGTKPAPVTIEMKKSEGPDNQQPQGAEPEIAKTAAASQEIAGAVAGTLGPKRQRSRKAASPNANKPALASGAHKGKDRPHNAPGKART